MDMNQLSPPAAYRRASNLDTAMTYMGSLMSFLARGEDTAGRFALMEVQTQPGNEPPPHVHAWEDELFYVLEGELEVYCEDKILLIGAGEVAFLPQGKAHAFTIRSPFARVLVLVQASSAHAVGLDRYFSGMGAPATSMTLPKNAITYAAVDLDHASRLAAANGIRILSSDETAKALPQYPGFGVSSAPASRKAATDAAVD